jgi:murein DD-endopeptidase MepM/ murein hydrolase activator NlpD
MKKISISRVSAFVLLTMACVLFTSFRVLGQNKADTTTKTSKVSTTAPDSLLENEDEVDEDSDEIDSLLGSFWETNQIFAYRKEEAFRDSIKIALVDSARQFCNPREGKVLYGFGPRRRRNHKGMDIRLKTGDPVAAAFDGVVRYAHKNRRGFGNLVVIRHFNGLETYYAHLSKINVESLQAVKAGEVIGLGGSTGRSRGPHLHFEVRYHDKAFDPERIIDFEKGMLKTDTLLITKDIFEIKRKPKSKTQTGTEVLKSTDVTIHKVRKGDTLGKIAIKYGTTITRICKDNKITRKTKLKIGRKLKIS